MARAWSAAQRKDSETEVAVRSLERTQRRDRVGDIDENSYGADAADTLGPPGSDSRAAEDANVMRGSAGDLGCGELGRAKTGRRA